ncbi:ABC transporter substrate-binding protein [Paenibacillus baekrokdamisoli]|uniref:ABC transporter substrate-binding protein n=1 Tax=Paenibacillus baekrokdamisoli TaxID=1712516 RepID=A0A3G9IWW9_9BACL|nr:extracellular solute-binding protein [Paenibacillus baekrokdamisoli]MBB3070006.1 ABC-type glycerol-3-phosphate transport system substrate-binding protein [Paenibacillus baekrokdamisoli]BBH20645.1 ABC transporter substrate-binding protein [Paenibacillus baekrokdamisoli]
MRRRLVKVTSVLLIVSTVISVYLLEPNWTSHTVKALNNQSGKLPELVPIAGSFKEGGYDEYVSKHKNAPMDGQPIIIEGENYSKVQGMKVSVLENYKGEHGKSILTQDTGEITWTFDAMQDGLYNLSMKFYSEPGKQSDIERELRIDGALPFNEAISLTFNRIWKNEKQTFDRDDRGNDLVPNQVEVPMWQQTQMKDSTGFYEEPFLFYLSKGKHSLSLTSVKEPLVIDQLKLSPPDTTPSYKEVASTYTKNGYEPVQGVLIKLQAEQALYKSSPNLLPYNDHASPAVEPFHVSKLRNNAMGGWGWRLPGQWIEWEIDVPQEGLYQMAFKNRQNYMSGMSVLRTMYIDGKLPFKELQYVPFPYGTSWQMNVIGQSEGEPYLFHLAKGKHRIRMEVTLGELAPILRSVQSSILALNAMYREIISYTGTVPDTFRDYNLEQRIPTMTEVFREQSKQLELIAERMEGPSGTSDERTAIIRTIIYQLNNMADNPESVPSRIDTFKTNVGALGSWMLSINEQPLALDYLVVSSPKAKLPKPEASSWTKLVTGAKSFAASFYENYDDFSGVQAGGQSVSVWVTSARDQAQVIKRLVDDSFTEKTGIHVNLKLVSGDVLLPSTVAGKGPDIALQVGNDLPVNYASRSALVDLSAFEGFSEIEKQFSPSAMVPYAYKGGYYALPEQQTFPVLFYRKDILENELHLKVPQTWNDVYEMLPILQKHNLQFGLPQKPLDSLGNDLVNTNIITLPPNPALAMFLFQHGGQFYKDGGKASDLDSETAIGQFKQWTDFYVNYKIPIAADFANRFRTGEMPIGITDYTMYNKLSVFAPEIKGLWSFAPVPGTVGEDGTLHREVGSGGSASVMFEHTKNKEAAWAFLKWWTGTDTQIAYGRQMEIRMGASARYPTANLQALAALPWPTKDYQKLKEQLRWVQGIPEVPGGYLTGRNIDNAFRRIVVQGDDPRETVDNYVRIMNEEITLKRKEFHIPDKK